MQFAAARGAVGKEAFKELDGGGDDDGRVPVFTGVAQFVAGVAVLQFAVIEGAVLFQHRRFAERAEGVAEGGGVLLNDAGKGDDVDDAPLSVLARVFEGKRHRGVGFAAAGGHGQGKEAGRERCLLLCVVEDVAAQAVQFGLTACACGGFSADLL